MDKIFSKVKIILIVVIIIVLIGVAIILFSKDETPSTDVKSEENSQTKQVLENLNEIKSEGDLEIKQEIISDELIKSQLIVQARSFVERYGTYSLDNGFNNLKYLRPMVSQKLNKEFEDKINQGFSSDLNRFNQITEVTGIEIKSFENEKAIILVNAQEKKDTNLESTFKQRTVEIIFIKENNFWRVDEINYQN